MSGLACREEEEVKKGLRTHQMNSTLSFLPPQVVFRLKVNRRDLFFALFKGQKLFENFFIKIICETFALLFTRMW